MSWREEDELLEKVKKAWREQCKLYMEVFPRISAVIVVDKHGRTLETVRR